MRSTYRMLGIFLALLLVSSNVAFSGHVSAHLVTDSGLCSLCVHAGGSDNAITPEPGTLPVTSTVRTFDQESADDHFAAVVFHDYQSRAPPRLPE